MSSHLQTMLDLEAIKALKAKYFRSVDKKDWAVLLNCFTNDLIANFREGPGLLVESRDNCVAHILKDAQTVHHGHMPEILFSGDGSATGIWAMEDIVKLPGLFIHGWGHCHEKCCKEEGIWKISSIKLTRLGLLQNGEEQKLGKGVGDT